MKPHTQHSKPHFPKTLCPIHYAISLVDITDIVCIALSGEVCHANI
ncbi:hypothetical protein I3271_05310 [Photobacterium leiognathi]|nr:hypothetical protein [Photobacterium leiognathi]MCG3884098.1 hypothetical protein [Photobacterium leiognathi]